jgi:hypothetical protein
MLAAIGALSAQDRALVGSYAPRAFENMAVTLAQIKQLAVAGDIDQNDASILWEMQKNAAHAILQAATPPARAHLADELLAAALTLVRGIVNRSIGFPLL